MPPDAERPSADQLGALKHKLASGDAPYVDLTIWCPFGKRGAKIRKFDAQVWVDNELRTKAIGGPSNFEAWLACWRIFRSGMIMNNAASPAVLDRYADGIRDMARNFKNFWGVVFLADELNRFERWDSIYEDLVDGTDAFRTNCEFDVERPWNTVIRLSTFGEHSRFGAGCTYRRSYPPLTVRLPTQVNPHCRSVWPPASLQVLPLVEIARIIPVLGRRFSICLGLGRL